MNIQKIFIFSFLKIAGYFRTLMSESEASYKLLFIPGFEKTRWQIGKWKAWLVFEKAKKVVPAYHQFLKDNGKFELEIHGWGANFTSIPITDKESYIKKYSIESRCLYGHLPKSGVIIDESSGTSGTSTNWVRGSKERAAVKYALQTAVHSLMGDKPIFFINAFALGPWATGMNVSMSLVDISIIKSTGPDIKKIENTLKFFGPKYTYIIAGYPPFLKALIDTADVPWKKYTLTAFFGGEGMSEGLRSYLDTVFRKIYGSYGASDLEINIAAENDFTIALRKMVIKNKFLHQKMVRPGTVPMIFQYNPLDYYIESNEQGELIVTLCRASNVAPKIRYNIHDSGQVMRFHELETVLKECGLSLKDIGKAETDLPLLFHYGRADLAVAFYGCKITPLEMEDIIFTTPDLSKKVHSFSLITTEDKKLNKKLILALEIREGLPTSSIKNREKLRGNIFEALKKSNQDFRESSKMIPKGLEPQLEIYSFGQGPFAINDIRLKKHYIQTR